MLKARGRQRTDSTHVLAACAPDWLRSVPPAAWQQRYGRRAEQTRVSRFAGLYG